MFGASRGGGRKHLGLDLISVPGDEVVAPISGRVVKVGWAYPDADLGSLTIEGEGATFQLLYVRSLQKVGTLLTQGDVVGEAQDVAAYYARKGQNGMTNHVHGKLTLVVDPGQYLPNITVPDAGKVT